jgi:putative addiction module CopG family antidote
MRPAIIGIRFEAAFFIGFTICEGVSMTEPLPADIADFVSDQLASGRYSSVDELAIAALRHLRDVEARDVEQLRGSLEVAREQLSRGEGIDLTDAQSRRAYFEDVLRSSIAGPSSGKRES